MKPKEIAELIDLQGKCSYHDDNKAKFKQLSMKLLRTLRQLLEIEADIRFSAGGIAVSGDATLHGDNIYVSMNADCSLGIMYRQCNGRKDYCGKTNCWYHLRRLSEDGVEGLAAAIKTELASPR